MPNLPVSAFLLSLALSAAAPALAADKVTFGTNWLAQAEHGGYYQAIADGTYAKYGLDVSIRQGGPQAANRNLLIAGQIDFYMGGTLGSFDAVAQGIPLVTVAAIFQKDPQGILAHPDAGIETFEDLAKAKTIFMGKEGFTTYFTWMKANFKGFSDEQFKPYQFNPGPFLADKASAQQGYITSEPFEIERQAGFKPKVFLLADAGYDPYSTTIETQTALVEKNPDLVQRFVDATAIGWYNYMHADNKAANALIKTDNPEMTDEQLAFSLAKMKEFDVLESGDAKEGGIGCMTDAHYKDFYDKMAAIDVVKKDLDIKKSYTLQFTCKKVGMDLKKS